jgi:CRP-like cAMP-binding protein
MAVDDDIRILSGVSLFSELANEHLRLLAFGSENVSCPSGTVLYRQGDPADGAYVVVKGRVVLFRDRDGASEDLATVEAGAMLGEMALIADTRRMTHARADMPTELLRVNRKLFRRVLEEYPELAAKLHQRISHDLQDLLARITALGSRFS